MTDLVTAVRALLDPDVVTEGDFRRTDPSLLEQLDTAVIPSGRSDNQGRLASERGNLSGNAADLRATIIDYLDLWLIEAGFRPRRRTRSSIHGQSVIPILRRWYRLTINLDQDPRKTETIQTWATEIRDLLEGVDDYAYDEACPLCGNRRAIWRQDGQSVEGAALHAMIRGIWRTEGSYGYCRACETVVATVLPDDLGGKEPAIVLRYQMNTLIEQARELAEGLKQNLGDTLREVVRTGTDNT